MSSILNRNYPETLYVIWKFKGKSPEINIDGNDLNYAQLGEHHHGLQCNVRGDNPKHEIIQKKCKEIANLFREIEQLNKL